MSEPAKELFATPADAQRRADALLERWNALQGQALGPGVQPREDVPRELQDRIVSDLKRYRKFIMRPTFGMMGALLPLGVRQGDYEVLEKWYATYRRRADALGQVVPEGLKGRARPIALPARDDLSWVPTLGRNIAIALGLVGAVGVAIAVATSSGDEDDDLADEDLDNVDEVDEVDKGDEGDGDLVAVVIIKDGDHDGC